MSSTTLSTYPVGHETLASALLNGLAAARRADSARHVRATAAPKPNCHDAVDTWVSLHPGTLAVRGWLCLGVADGTARFYAHSLVRDTDGALVDPTFSPTDYPLPFVPHPRHVGGFFGLLCMPQAPHELIAFGVPDQDPA
ncbi:MAG: hypothetical protein EPN65_22340 [Pandoraea sp.]|uniref:hypothetical protein n=1 Tax=Pandoraea sp. TaxID=1883445 RepID=UPI001208FD4E|nr:hypothetical protein [Pandoraea sp.]TAM13429.1 MAG: hypothetical protein EPN65_22340 [Pandoraea sp.]TAM51235.1 MAG: hypothetical protein EPN57_18470 [Paraburkholderia sp.]